MSREALHDFEGRGKKFINPRAIMSVQDNNQGTTVNLLGGAVISVGVSAAEVAKVVNKMANDDDE